MRKRSGLLALLPLALVTAAVLPPPAQGAGIQLFESVEGSLSDGPLVHKNQDVAQSFAPLVDFRLSRIDVHVYDLLPGNVLNLSLRPDASGLPSDTILAWAAADGIDGGYDWLTFSLNRSVDVAAGSTHWVVLEDESEPAKGYRWGMRSGDTYPRGNYALRGGAGSWSTIVSDDLQFRAWGVRGPLIAAEMVVDSPTAGILDLLTYTAYFNNSGTQPASLLWANVTLSGNTTYVSDTAVGQGGTPTGPTSWVFSDVAVGPHGFDVLVRVNPDAFDGLPLVASVLVAYVDPSGAPQESTQAGVTVLARVPSLTLQKAAPSPFVAPAEPVNYTITLVNSGSRPASAVWVNDTLPPEVQYVGTDANLLAEYAGHWFDGGSLHVNLSNLPQGTFAFDVLTRVRNGTANGTVIVNEVAATFTDSQGTVVPQSPVALATIRIHGASIRVDLVASVQTAVPGGDVVFTIRYDNLGNAVARRVWFNVTLPGELAYVSDTGGGTAMGQTVSFSFTDVGVGIHSVFLRARVGVGVPDGTLLRTSVDLAHTDADFTPLAPSSTSVDVTAVAAVLSATANPPPTVDPGGPLALDVALDNRGSAVAPHAWLNLTVPAELTEVSDTAGAVGGVRTTGGWWFGNVAPGGLTFTVTFRVQAGLGDGTVLALPGEGTYVDAGGQVRAFPVEAANVTVTAPRFDLQASASTSQIALGGSLDLLLRFANSGRGVASHVWVNVTLPQGVSVANASEPWTSTTGLRFTWLLPSVAPGTNGEILLTLDVPSVRAESPTVAVSLAYTDANGNPAGALTTAVPFTILRPGWTAHDLGLLLLLSLVAAMSSFIGYRVYGLGSRERGRIQQLFLLHKSGVLIKHYSRSLRGTVDSDILAAMLVAVQNFVRDSFRLKEGQLEEMKFGPHNFFMMHGHNTILAALVTGRFLDRTKVVLHAAVQRLEEEYAEQLEDWSGSLEAFRGIDDIMDEVVQGRVPARESNGFFLNGNGRGRKPA